MFQKFPNESLSSVVRNVFDFDRHSEEVYETLTNILHKHGIPIGTNPANIVLAKEISLPAMQVWGTWTVLNKSLTVHVEERHVKLTKATGLTQMVQQLDRTDARSAWFTEMQKYWTLPLTETGTVAGLAVGKGISETALDDKIHILTTNPLSIFTMRPDANESLQTVIHHLLKSEGGLKPQYTIATDNDQNVLVHMERTNNLLFINTVDGTARTLQFSSILDAASDRLTRLKQNNVHWKMITDLIPSQNQIIFFTQNNSRIEIIDLKSMCAYSFNLPFDIKSILIGSDTKWLIQDTKRGKHMFSKSVDTMPSPNVLQEIQESTVDALNGGTLLSCGTNNLSNSVISSALNQKIDSPNRLLVTDNSHGGIAVGFPDLDSLHELHFWPRGGRSKNTMKPIVTENGDVIRTVALSDIPEEVYRKDSNFLAVNTYFEIVDVGNRKLRYIPIPDPVNLSSAAQWLYGKDVPIYTSRLSNEGLVSVDAGGCIRLWETATASIERSLDGWQKMVGGNERPLQITKERYSGLDVNAPKHGKVDEKNEPHVGGNTWAGGTGGRDTAGLGGKGGPYRLDAGHTVHQLSDEEKNSIPEHVKKAAQEMGQRAFKQRLRDIRMSEYDHKLYSRFSDVVHKQVQALRVIIGSLHAKSKERQWCRHQTSGELDDTKLIEGLTGERTIYRRRAEKDPEIGAPALKPKYLRLVVDVSGSMYRFNGYDGRLDRELEACTMVMEAFNGYESKFKYDIIGHSGDDYNIPFVHSTQPPTDNKRRLEVIKTMYAHSQFCISGDHTLEATQFAITNLAKEETDESIVIVLSDANLERYGIRPQVFTKVLMSDSNVNAFAIFIGSLGDQADRLIKQMPSGRAFVCMDLKDIPRIMQQIFSASLLGTTQCS